MAARRLHGSGHLHRPLPVSRLTERGETLLHRPDFLDVTGGDRLGGDGAKALHLQPARFGKKLDERWVRDLLIGFERPLPLAAVRGGPADRHARANPSRRTKRGVSRRCEAFGCGVTAGCPRGLDS